MAKLDWQKIDEIFPRVADLAPAEREGRLLELCDGDEDLHGEIAAMLSAEEKAEDFIETPVMLPESLSKLIPATSEGASPATLELAGRQIGSYRVVRKIGVGGMGAVYLAERADGEFRKKAAIKLVKNGADTGFNLRRFRHERQILAALEHPNIARLMDGGTSETGAPYLVMEYVEGKPLFDFCVERNLDLRTRLGLFRQICAAVAYAHEQGIVHRDIKPGNILVTPKGAVKLLDFGIAKILNGDLIPEKVEQTETLLRQMTPEYASPEQICGEEITPASDVYSLGVVLFELLTGERPYKFPSRAPHEIARVICEETPSSFVPQKLLAVSPDVASADDERIAGDDLKFIVLKSLQKKPVERYASVGSLDRDVEAVLVGVPFVRDVERRRFFENSTGYSGEKTGSLAVPDTSSEGEPRTAESALNKPSVAQLKWFVAAMATLAAIVLPLFLYYHFVGFRVIKRTIEPADKSSAVANQKEDVKTSLSGDAAANDFYHSGKQQMELRSKDGIGKAEEFFNEAARRDPGFALAYSGLANTHILSVRYANAAPETAYRKAEEFAVKALALDPDLAEARVSLGMAVFRTTQNFEQAEKHFLRAIEINPSYSTAHHWYSVILDQSGRKEDAIREIKIAADLEPDSAVIQNGVGALLFQKRDWAEAIVYFDRAIAREKSIAQPYVSKSLAQQMLGDYAGALETYRAARIFKGENENEPLWIIMQAHANAAGGLRNEALGHLKSLFATSQYRKEPHLLTFDIALVHALLGDKDQAFAALEKVKMEKMEEVEMFISDPRFVSLHGDIRFQASLEKMKTQVQTKFRGRA